MGKKDHGNKESAKPKLYTPMKTDVPSNAPAPPKEWVIIDVAIVRQLSPRHIAVTWLNEKTRNAAEPEYVQLIHTIQRYEGQVFENRDGEITIIHDLRGT